MIFELKTFKFCCDKCSTSITQQSQISLGTNQPDELPINWKYDFELKKQNYHTSSFDGYGFAGAVAGYFSSNYSVNYFSKIIPSSNTKTYCGECSEKIQALEIFE